MWNIFQYVLRSFIVENNYKLLVAFQGVDVYLMTNQIWWTNQISQSIKLAGQRPTRDRSAKDKNNAYFWERKIRCSLAIKEEAKNVIFCSKKDSTKVKNRYFNGFGGTS